MQYNPEQFDHEREYDERYYMFKNHIQELSDAKLIYFNKDNNGEYILDKNFNIISKVTIDDLATNGEGMNNYPLNNVKEDGEGMVNKYKVWIWLKCVKGMLFNIELVIDGDSIL